MPSVAHHFNYVLSDEGASWIESKWKCEDPFVVAGPQAAERLQTVMDGDKVTVIVVPCRTSASYMLDIIDASVFVPRILPDGFVKVQKGTPRWYKPSIWMAV